MYLRGIGFAIEYFIKKNVSVYSFKQHSQEDVQDMIEQMKTSLQCVCVSGLTEFQLI